MIGIGKGRNWGVDHSSIKEKDEVGGTIVGRGQRYSWPGKRKESGDGEG